MKEYEIKRYLSKLKDTRKHINKTDNMINNHKSRVIKRQYKLDLHNLTINDAYHTMKRYLDDCQFIDIKYVTIITGKSGIIKKEFPSWMETLSYKYSPINDGSWKVYIK